jgi:iron complex outermembrane receptor protein
VSFGLQPAGPTNPSNPSIMTLSFTLADGRMLRVLLSAACICTAATLAAGAQVKATKRFSIPSGSAAQTLKQFAEQSGRGVAFVADLVDDIETKAVQGELQPAEALRRMLAGTALVAEEDQQTGAFAIRRVASDPNGARAASVAAPMVRPERNEIAVARTPAAAAAMPDKTVNLDAFVITGVFTETPKEKTTASITAVPVELLARQVPVSGADILLNVPGVYVNSSLGEIRNIVYSRGISASADDGARGYFYVSMQEDGLPITNVNLTNFGPDYFLRPDATLRTVEAVRGGPASVTAENAPGGVFNYISKTGTSTHTGEIRVRLGLKEEDSGYYRGDFNFGGPIGSKGWVYNVGGFYREDEGHRPPSGFPMDDGFAVKGNIFRDYGSGSIKVYGKFLDDRNHWYEYQLGLNPEDPKQIPELTRWSTNLLPAAQHQYIRHSPDNIETWDTTDKVHSMQRYLGADWKHEFGDGWRLSNNARVSRSRTNRNTSAGVSPRSLDWPNFFNAMALTFSGGPQGGRVPAGTYQFTNRATGALVAEVTSTGGYPSTGSAPSNPGQVVRIFDLPNRNLEIADGSFNPVWTATGSARKDYADEFMNRLSITKQTERMTFTGGVFYAQADILRNIGSGGNAAYPLVEQPQPLGITWIPATADNAPPNTAPTAIAAVAGWNGQPVQLTNPNGYTSLGLSFSNNEATAEQMAAFFGHKWEFNNRLSFDWGVRMERYAAKGVNEGGRRNAQGNWDPTFGGRDGDPLTLWDNRYQERNPNNSFNYDRDVDSFSWSAAASYVFNDRNSAYLRHTSAEKAPNFDFFLSLTTPFRIANLPARPQTVEQWELGYRFNHGRLSLIATPFWSRLGDIFSNPQATEADGVTPYFPDPVFNVITSYGIELEGSFRLSPQWNLRTVLTFQESEGTVWKVFVAGGNGRDDDRFIDFSGLPSDNNPDIIANTSIDYRNQKLFSSLAWKHMGERAGNIANVITLPRFNQFDLVVGYDFTPKFSLMASVNNLTDSKGVMTWRGWGVNPGDRQSFTQLPATGERTLLQFLPILPRAYYLTATYRF